MSLAVDEPGGVEGEDTSSSPSGFSGGAAGENKPVASKFAGLGPLLEEQNPATVVKAIEKMITDQKRSRRRRRVQAEANKLALRGIRGVRVRRNRTEDYDDVDLFVPGGAYDLPPIMDRSDELLEKVVSNLVADPALPDAQPATDEDVDRDAAEFTTRLLTAEGAESGFNNTGLMRRAGRKAGFWGSAFLYPCIDPMGGGWRPMEIQAHPAAAHKDQATINPETGAEVPEDKLSKRYVRADGSLTDTVREATEQWIPKLKPEVLTPENVVLIPETCTSIADATGGILIRHTELGKLKAQFPALTKLDNDKFKAMAEWNPEDSKATKKGFAKKAIDIDASGVVPDTAMVCTLSLYMVSHGAYKKGAYIVVAGENLILHRATHSGMVEGPKGELVEECLELPLAQIRQLDDDIFDDPMGRGLVEKFGPADEVRGEIVLAWLEYLDRFNHPHQFLPVGSIVQPDALAIRDGQPIYFNPMGQPVQEKIDGFPNDAKEFFDRAGQSQDSASGLEATAQGVDSPNSESGVAKMAVIQQAHVNLTTTRQNLADGQERWWRIVTQIFRVYYTVPMLTKITGEDGSYKEAQWTRADLKSTKDIRIARGSFTQQSPEQKQAKLDARFANQQIAPDEYERLSDQNLQAGLGYQDNPHRMRVRSQIIAFRDGPPENFEALAMQFEQETAAFQSASANIQAVVQQADAVGLPVVQPPAPPQVPVDQTLAMNPFADVRDVDEDQDVAALRYREMRREMASKAFGKKHPKWQAFFRAEAKRMRMASGQLTLAEQQQAQQAAAEAQAKQAADAEQAKLVAKQQEKAMDIDARRSESAANRGAAADAQAQDAAIDANASAAEREANAAEAENERTFQLQREAMRSEGSPMLTT